MDETQFVWAEKYRPKTIAECVLPDRLRTLFQGILTEKRIPHLLMSGPAGSGKTTVARALCSELGYEMLFLNGSLKGNIETLRTTIADFADLCSMSGAPKAVILDEADYLNIQSTQPALRGFIEQFSDNCTFILTCNFKNKIMSPLHSRCVCLDFAMKQTERKPVLAQFMARLTDILLQEKVTCDKKVLAQVIMRFAPDCRKTIGHLQSYAMSNNRVIDVGVLGREAITNMDDLILHMQNKVYDKVREWVIQNVDNDPVKLYRAIYDAAWVHMVPDSIPDAVVILADYMDKHTRVADPEICILACLTEMMGRVEWVPF